MTTFVKDRAGFQRNGSPDNELQNGWGVYDCGLANQNLILKATELGLGTLVMGIRDERAIRELLEIPVQETIVSVIGVGYPNIEPSMPKRKTIEEVSKALEICRQEQLPYFILGNGSNLLVSDQGTEA